MRWLRQGIEIRAAKTGGRSETGETEYRKTERLRWVREIRRGIEKERLRQSRK
jgi:hypothetical protein